MHNKKKHFHVCYFFGKVMKITQAFTKEINYGTMNSSELEILIKD